MKVAELRAQGWTAIQGDVLTNNLSERIVLSFNGAFSVNNGHHDELEIVDLLWREPSNSIESMNVPVEFNSDGYWRPYLGRPSNADEQLNFVDNETSNATVKTHIESMHPMFTQAMADAGEFPPVDSKFMMGGWKEACVMTAVGKVNILFDYCGIEYVREIENIKFSPFDDRTPKQKAVDAAVYAVEKKGFIANDLLAATEAFGIAFDAGLLHLQSNEQ